MLEEDANNPQEGAPQTADAENKTTTAPEKEASDKKNTEIQEQAENIEDVPYAKGEKKATKVESATPEEFSGAIYNVPVKVTAVLGSMKMSVEELVKLGRGAILQLNKPVGDPIDIFVNDRLVARGEVVLVEGNLGMTVTELMRNHIES